MSEIKTSDEGILVKSGKSIEKGNIEYVHPRASQVVTTTANTLRTAQKDQFVKHESECSKFQGGTSTEPIITDKKTVQA